MSTSLLEKHSSLSWVVAYGQEVIHQEAQALSLLRDALGPPFQDVILCLLKTKGKIVLSGVGKSGHIAQKIASTLSSLGSPAFFIHPTEAAHGDLGSLETGDVLFLISNSGQTAELKDLIPYARSLALAVIVITTNEKSDLARLADYTLLLPKVPEACPMGLAPTTSSTLTLVLGDALALSLLKARNFTKEDYRQRHPAGALGYTLLRVQDIMLTGNHLPLVPKGTRIGDALIEMTSKKKGCVGVVDQENPHHLIGLISDGDLRRHMSPNLLSLSVEDIMTPSPVCIPESRLVSEVLAQMNEMGITFMFVVDEQGRLRGMTHMHDCLSADLRGRPGMSPSQ